MVEFPLHKIPSAAAIWTLLAVLPVRPFALTSPDGKVEVNVSVQSGRLSYELRFDGASVIQTSALGITVGGQDLGANAVLGAVAADSAREEYSVLGKKSMAVSHYKENRVTVTSGGVQYHLEVRAFNDGAAFRYVVPGSRTVNGEATSFTLPAGSRVHFQPNVAHYEGNFTTKDIAAMTTSDVAGPPLTAKLPGTQGYAAITEGDLRNYSGMSLRGAGNRVLRANFASAIGSVRDSVVTPWRVIMVARDLDGLVNCDIVQHVAPPPDPALFPKGALTEWIKPGRVSWSWMASNYGAGVNPANMRTYSDNAARLGWEYNIVDDGWAGWSDAWATMKSLVEYAKEKKVGTIAWVRYTDLDTEAKRTAYFKKAAEAGLAGLKIDFMDSEARNIIDWYPEVLALAARNRMILDFHGAGKPTGLERTYPNELTREAIKGREYASANANNLYYPFTRYLAGHADYTPLWLTKNLGSTSHAHQIAGAVIYTSPLLVFCENPATLLANPAVDVIKAIPSTWDETRVLPPSEINDVAVFARRKGRDWFVAVLNAGTQRNLNIPLSFLGPASYRTQAIRDEMGNAGALVLDAARSYRAGDALSVSARAWGGFVAHLKDESPVVTIARPEPPFLHGSGEVSGMSGTWFDVSGRRHLPVSGTPGKGGSANLRAESFKLLLPR